MNRFENYEMLNAQQKNKIDEYSKNYGYNKDVLSEIFLLGYNQGLNDLSMKLGDKNEK